MSDKLIVPVGSLSATSVASLCLERFYSLPKTGKPADTEWTVLSGIVLYDCVNDSSKVVALGAGTKCVGRGKLCPFGLTLNDSHAEVLARRSLLRFFYRELHGASSKDNGRIFRWQSEKSNFALRDGISFHFFSTRLPCGDASILSEAELEQEPPSKRVKLASNSEGICTGAKLIGEDHCDIMEQTLGALRTKPGRGDRTLSMSCSDKLAKWNLMGVQGALLDLLLEKPIYFQSFNFCCTIDEASLKRAIFERFPKCRFKNERYQPVTPNINFCTDHDFKYHSSTVRVQPSPNGLAWCDIDERLKPYEVSVNGKRQGVTAKKLGTPQSALKISKYFLLQEFVQLLRTNVELAKHHNLLCVKLEDINYFKFKRLSNLYQSAWSEAKTTYFQLWTQKPEELLYFCLNKVNEKCNN